MTKLTALSIALVLLLISFPLTSLGTAGDTAWLWWLGLILLTIGGLIPPVTRYTIPTEENGEE
ncbi:MAG TPA: hypothetical protein GX702_08265 [Chloroflexi bacterium]|jgi:hypothetical protein|nr:hypothetical protein [Chloroflexota bacterium]